MTLDDFLSYLMGWIYDVKLNEKELDLKTEKLWKKWRWIKSLNLSNSLNILADIEKILIGFLAETLNLDDHQIERLYNEKF